VNSKTTSNFSPSWTFATWPDNVFPCSGAKARGVVRKNKDALLAAGAVSRIGREIVVFGVQYNRWLAKQAHRVNDFEIAANRPEHAHKRAGRAGRSASVV
jgi:hypothetical protein